MIVLNPLSMVEMMATATHKVQFYVFFTENCSFVDVFFLLFFSVLSSFHSHSTFVSFWVIACCRRRSVSTLYSLFFLTVVMNVSVLLFFFFWFEWYRIWECVFFPILYRFKLELFGPLLLFVFKILCTNPMMTMNGSSWWWWLCDKTHKYAA